MSGRARLRVGVAKPNYGIGGVCRSSASILQGFRLDFSASDTKLG